MLQFTKEKKKKLPAFCVYRLIPPQGRGTTVGLLLVAFFYGLFLFRNGWEAPFAVHSGCNWAPVKKENVQRKKKCTWLACVVSCLKNFLNWRAPTLEWCIYLYFMQNKILWGACCEVNAESVCLSLVAGAAAILVSGGVDQRTALLQNRELHACVIWMKIWKGKILVMKRFFRMLSFI